MNEKNVNYSEDEIFEEEQESAEGQKKEGTNSEKVLRICIAAIIVAVLVVALLISVIVSMRSDKEETTTVPEETTSTVAEEITTSPAEKYKPGNYTVKVGETGRLNLRKEPSKDGEQILGIPSGTVLEIKEIKYDETADEDSQYWGRTLYKGWDAWVSMKYLVNAYSDNVVTPEELTTAPEQTTGTEEQTTASFAEQTTAAAPEQTTAAAPEATTSSSASSAFATGTYTVIAEPHLNMREDHNVDSLSIAQIPANSTVTVVDVYHDANSTNEYTKYWGKVTFGGYTGWVAMGYLK